MQVEGHKSYLPRGASWAIFLRKMTLALACLLLASAGLSWLAANWAHASVFQKLAGTQALLVLLVLLAWRQRPAVMTPGVRDFTPFAVLTALAAVVVGGLLALVGQIYQTGADPWELFLWWAALLLPWLLVLRTVFLGLLCALLLNLAAARYLSLLEGSLWFGTTLHWSTAGLMLALANTGMLALWEACHTKLGDTWRIGPRLQATAVAGWLVVAALAGFDSQSGPVSSVVVGLMAMALMYRAYTAMRPDLAMVSLAAATAFLLFSALLLRWADSEGSLLLVIIVLTALAGLALRQLGKLIGRQGLDHTGAEEDDVETGAALSTEPWYVNLFRLAVMGLMALLSIVLLFMTFSPDQEVLWLVGLVMCAVGLLIVRGVAGWLQAFGMALGAAGLLLAGGGLYVLDGVDPWLRAGAALLLGAGLYSLAGMAALRFLCAVVVLGLVCALTWPGYVHDAPYELFDGGPSWLYLPAYVRLWWLAVAAVLALAASRRSQGKELCLPLAWACICLAQTIAWVAPAPTILGLGEVWRNAPSIILVWLGCALLPVAALGALLAGRPDMPRTLAVTAPLALAVAALGWMGAPGVSLALLWMILGYGLVQRSLLVFGVLALLTYLGRFYYQMDATLVQKSLILGLTGAWLLVMWRILRTKATPAATAPSGQTDTAQREAQPNRQSSASRLTAGLAVGLILSLSVANTAIYQREQILASGQPVVLALAPVDPRSLMQGDYMALRFAASDEVRQALSQSPALTQAIERQGGGWMVLRADADGVHHARAVSTSPAPETNGLVVQASDVVLKFGLRHGQVHIVTDAWFFPEGQASRYEQARYGELRVGEGGTGLLLRMLDAQRKPLS